MTVINPAIEGNINIPKNMHLKKRSGRLEFEYSWFKIKYLIALFAVPFFTYFLVNSKYIVGGFNELTASVILAFTAALFVFYFSLAKLINTTKISVSREGIKVGHGPLLFSKNLIVKRDDVTQLYVTKHRFGHRYYLYSTTFQINVILKNKNVLTLVKGLHSAGQGRFIENEIEDFLDITDIHVEGELAKK
jgi:hypothetical protein